MSSRFLDAFRPTQPTGPEVTYIRPEYPPVRVELPDTPPPGSGQYPVDPRKNTVPFARDYQEAGAAVTWYLLGRTPPAVSNREGGKGATETLLAAVEGDQARDALLALLGGAYASERRRRHPAGSSDPPGLEAAILAVAGSEAAAATLRADLAAQARTMLEPCWPAVQSLAELLAKRGRLAPTVLENTLAASVPAMSARVGWRLLAQVESLSRRVAELEAGKG
jgi:hypothetical protein